MNKVIKQFKKEVEATPAVTVIKAEDLLSSGSTHLNLSCTGKRTGAYPKGTYVLFVGDSSAGKTWLALTALAEAANNKHFDGYDLIYDGPENGALMDQTYYYGNKFKERVRPPAGTNEAPEYSENVEGFYGTLNALLDAGKPFIYVLDSMDALSCIADDLKFQEDQKAIAAGKAVSGTYGTEKAKINSKQLRSIGTFKLQKCEGSILFIMSQTRDNIGFGAQFNPKTRGGGKAMKFYAGLEMWFSIRQELKKRVRGKERHIGTLSKIDIKKNRVNGKKRSVEVPIINGIGVDDVANCINFLIEEKEWTVGKGSVDTKGFMDDLRNSGIEDLANQINEDPGSLKNLKLLVTRVWKEIEAELEPTRKPRYQ